MSAPQVISHLNQSRADAAAISDATGRYVPVPFRDTHGSTKNLVAQDPMAFTTAGPPQAAVRCPAVTSTSESIRLFGGERDGNQTNPVPGIDPAAGHESVPRHRPHPQTHIGEFTRGGATFSDGDGLAGNATDKPVFFDPAPSSFAFGWHLPDARPNFRVATVSETACLVGRENPQPVDIVVPVHAQAGGTP